MIPIIGFLALLGIAEREFFDEKIKWEILGYKYWDQIECRAPDPNAKALVIRTPIGMLVRMWFFRLMVTAY